MAVGDAANRSQKVPFQLVLWAPREQDKQRILQELDPHDVIVYHLRDPEGVSQVATAEGGNVAVICLEKPPNSQDPVLPVIRGLRERGFSVFVTSEGLATWPLTSRCHIQLAGVQKLFDSGEASFGSFRETLSRAAAAQICGKEEREQLEVLMKDHGIVGRSRAMQNVFRSVLRISRVSNLPVLIHGESGTGKELLAHAIYQLDAKRSRGPFVAVNCSAVSKELAESELFGHRRGAFTGAEHSRRGLIRSADGGVLLLDEIGELSLELQAKLLRVIQENRVLAVGEDEEVVVSVRIVVASHRSLQEMVRSGNFREDLFHRLNVLSVEIPPLRERYEDVPPLVEHFCEKYSHLRPELRIRASREFTEALGQLSLPGNARQLENIVRRAIAQKEEDAPLGLGDLPPDALRSIVEPQPKPFASEALGSSQVPQPIMAAELAASIRKVLEARGGNLSEVLRHCERTLLEVTQERMRGNQTQMAKFLGITPRSVYSKLRKYGLHSSRPSEGPLP
jgi:two-component system nitrogen regulation response regulator GlnG